MQCAKFGGLSRTDSIKMMKNVSLIGHLCCVLCTGKAHILEVLNALYHELAACEILSAAGPLERTQSQQSLNTLVISC